MLGDKEKSKKVESEVNGRDRTRSSLNQGFIFNKFNEFAHRVKLISIALISGTDQAAA